MIMHNTNLQFQSGEIKVTVSNLDMHAVAVE